MLTQKRNQIRDFCEANTNPDNIKKYARYFKEGFDAYGIPQEVFEAQRDKWIAEWNNEMTIEDYLDLGDLLMKNGKYEEKSFAIVLVKSKKEAYSLNVFDRIGTWFAYGIDNWATTDVLCMLVLSDMVRGKIVPVEKLMEWNKSESEWQRRCTPVTLNELVRDGITPVIVISAVESLMVDKSEYVQKGIGTLMRSLWKKFPEEVEQFLLNWKDTCGRLIIQYATEKMDKEYRKKFRKAK